MTIDAERQRLRKPYALTIIGTFEGKKSGLLKGGLPMILAIVNQKGGVAKSTSTIALGLHIARMGKKVLIIDTDPQADTTFGLQHWRGRYQTKPRRRVRTEWEARRGCDHARSVPGRRFDPVTH